MGNAPTRLRTWLGIAVAVAGAVLLVVGWYDVSGESDVGRQLPYIASATIPGGALVVAGAVLVAAERWRDSAERGEQKVDALYTLFTQPAADTAPPSSDAAAGVASDVAVTRPNDGADGRVVALDDGTRYHRPGCSLVAGKPARDVTAAEIPARHLEPCPVCDPPAAPS